MDLKKKFLAFVGVASLLTFVGCGDSSSSTSSEKDDGDIENPSDSSKTDDDENLGLSDVKLSGYTQKGPFVVGSTVTAFELNDGTRLEQTGGSFNGTIKSDDGHFDIKTVSLVSQYVSLVADGYYRNEVKREISRAPIKLRALVDLKDRSKANINLLTHLEYDRVMYYVTEKKMSFEDAKKAASRDVLEAFYISEKFNASEDVDIFGDSDQSAALLAISILLQGDRSEAQLTSLLVGIGNDISEDGKWDDVKTRKEIASWALASDTNLTLTYAIEHVKGWDLGPVNEDGVKRFVRRFWNYELGLGACNEDSLGKAKKFPKDDDRYAICEDGAWVYAFEDMKSSVNLSHLPKDTVEGTIVTGPIYNEYRYIFYKGEWYDSVSDEEVDIFNFQQQGVIRDDSLYYGTLTERFYVYVNGEWNLAGVYDSLMGYACTNKHAGEYKVFDDKVVYCKKDAGWSDDSYDHYFFGTCGPEEAKEKKIVRVGEETKICVQEDLYDNGNYNGSIYVWRAVTTEEQSCQPPYDDATLYFDNHVLKCVDGYWQAQED